MEPVNVAVFFIAILHLSSTIHATQEKGNNPYSGTTKVQNTNGPAKCEIAKAEADTENKMLQEVNKKHILMYHPWGTKSHRQQQHALLLGLLNAGHTVTGVFPEKSSIIHDGYTEIVVETRYIPQNMLSYIYLIC